jgi:uncharacterized membrane protein
MVAFSDAVIAILFTIMVLPLRRPHGTSFSDLRSLRYSPTCSVS